MYGSAFPGGMAGGAFQTRPAASRPLTQAHMQQTGNRAPSAQQPVGYRGQNLPHQQQQQQVQQQQRANPQAAVKNVEDFVKSLDAELARQRNQQAGQQPRSSAAEQTGLGLHVWEGADGYMVVKSVVPNGACAKSGLVHEGDAIISLDGIDMRGKKVLEFGKLALGPPGSSVRIGTRARNGAMNMCVVQRLGSSGSSSNAQNLPATHSSNHSTPSDMAEVPLPATVGPSAEQTAVSHSKSSLSTSINTDHLPGMPPGAVMKNTSGRKYPCRAIMQWDYIATRDDELTASAGENILVAGEYKNPGWVWGARIMPSGQPSSYRLVPANYMTYDETAAPEPSEPKRVPLQQQANNRDKMLPAVPPLKVPMASTSDTTIKFSVGGPPIQGTKPSEVPASDPKPQRLEPKIPSPQKPAAEQENQPHAPAAADEEDHAVSVGRELCGDADDPYLDGMYEDESGCISVNC